jgi:hypothetical protein
MNAERKVFPLVHVNVIEIGLVARVTSGVGCPGFRLLLA